MYRQGDVLLLRLEELPAALKRLPRESGGLVLAHGEATGHAHVVEGAAELLALDLHEVERRFLRVERECLVVHEEHRTMTLPPGSYEVRRQREYEPEGPRLHKD